MNHLEFEKRLQRTVGGNVWLGRDRRDNCFVIWDRTRSGDAYPAHKICCEHDNPEMLGTYRECYDADIRRLQRKDWFERFGDRKGAVAEVMDMFYGEQVRQERKQFDDNFQEVLTHQVTPYAEWFSGAKSLHGPGGGGVKSKAGRVRDASDKVAARPSA